MDEYFKGEKLYGDDFSFDQITKWYNEEAEGYAELGNKDKNNYSYGYHLMNEIHGFGKIKGLKFENAMGFGSAWGNEFEPIINNIKNLTIVEPSDNLKSNQIGHLKPKYIKPNIGGELPISEDSFDLITCFGTLHHIPNVSFVLSELFRVLKSNGFILIREPIVSMGDWRKPRKGLTKNERGIPMSFFNSELGKYSVKIVSMEYCFTLTSIFQKVLGKIIGKSILSNKTYILFDKYLSFLLKNNVNYKRESFFSKIAPTSIFYVLQKL